MNLRRIVDWVDHRTGLETAVRNFLYEDIPASSGWHQVFGSVALFLFLILAFTGVLLAFNYAPTPGDAYNSLKYIMTELTGGSLIRGLHHWGASMMIVVVGLHLTQVFLFGAYKKPREATWIVGVVLLLLTLAFGLTGYLLPWDNRAYWGTVVTTQMAAKAPLAGPYLTRFLGGEDTVGVVTFARFYALHVLLLPPITTFLIMLHVYLVRKHGVAPLPDDSGQTKKFFPGQVFKDTVAIFIAFAILLVMAIAVQAPLERLADPTDNTYIPRPDWYFLFLFETLKLFKGSLEIVGSLVLPTLAVFLLLLVPFIDRGAAKRLRERGLAVGVLCLAAIAWTGLTVSAIVTTPKSQAIASPETEVVEEWQQLTPEALAGIGYYRQEQCSLCHNVSDGTPKVGPNLVGTQRRRSREWILEHFKNPAQLVPGSSMPPTRLDDRQLAALTSFILKLTSENAKALEAVPADPVRGAVIYLENQCGNCHTANGQGLKVGPALNGILKRRSREWIAEQIRNPQSHTPDSLMPPFTLSPREMDDLVAFLLALPESKSVSIARLRTLPNGFAAAASVGAAP